MMNRKYTQSMTLRLEPQIDALLTEAAYDRRTTKAAWIRSAIRQGLGIADIRTGKVAELVQGGPR
jgi:predicted transcriptional regulator